MVASQQPQEQGTAGDGGDRPHRELATAEQGTRGRVADHQKGRARERRESLERELATSTVGESSNTLGRCAAAIALARAGRGDTLRQRLEQETDPRVADAMRDALAGNTAQAAFRALEPSSDPTPQETS